MRPNVLWHPYTYAAFGDDDDFATDVSWPSLSVGLALAATVYGAVLLTLKKLLQL